MKQKIYLILFIIITITTLVSLFTIQNIEKELINSYAKEDYKNRVKEYKVILEDKKNFLNSFAKFLSTSKPIIEGYLENNRTKIIEFVMPLYKSLYPEFIEEIHFFKPPAISFVDFSNLKAYNIHVGKKRSDILWISTSFIPSTHFYICRKYAGLRATYPIVYNNKLLGSISFGMNISVFKKLFQKLGAKKVTIYLSYKLLKESLSAENYLAYKKYPLYKDYRIIGEKLNTLLKPGYYINNKEVFIIIPIKDFFKKNIGYFVIEDDISNAILKIRKVMYTKLALEITGYLIILIILYLLFKKIFYKLHELYTILQLIKDKKFDKIPEKTVSNDKFDEFKNTLIEVAEDIKTYISALNMEIEKFENKAYKDALTNALNRRFLEEKAKEILLKYNPQKTNMGIIMLDIDNFKHINDTYGHDIGDLVLIELANTINRIIRKEDIFIRYGGEEFVIILPHSNIQNTYQVAEKIRKAIENTKIKLPEGELSFTISIGISEIRKDDKSIFEAIKRADINLYKAKKKGKNRVVF